MRRTRMLRMVLITLVFLGIPSVSSQEATFPALSAKNPILVPSASLVQETAANEELRSITRKYLAERRVRLEQHMLVPLLQLDLDSFYEFAVAHRTTEAALTAKLLIAVILMHDARRTEWPSAGEILHDIGANYSQKWQGKVAEMLHAAAQAKLEADPRLPMKGYQVMHEALLRAEPLMRELDDSNDINVESLRIIYLSNPQVTFEASLMEALGAVNVELGNHEEARRNYERMLALSLGTMSERKARAKLDSLARTTSKAKGEVRGDDLANENRELEEDGQTALGLDTLLLILFVVIASIVVLVIARLRYKAL